MVAGAVAAYYAEHPVNPEFATFGDSLWWAIVTLTTVGYGDIVPETTAGRIAAVMIMLTGVAVLGLLAGSLASFFRLQPGGSTADPTTAEPVPPAAGAVSVAPVARRRGEGSRRDRGVVECARRPGIVSVPESADVGLPGPGKPGGPRAAAHAVAVSPGGRAADHDLRRGP